jgi:hypothetical protein
MTRYNSILLNFFSNRDINFRSILTVSFPWDGEWRRMVVDLRHFGTTSIPSARVKQFLDCVTLEVTAVSNFSPGSPDNSFVFFSQLL